MSRFVAVLTLALVSAAAPAEILVHSGFESAQFTARVPLCGQTNWIEFFPPGASIVSDTGAAAGRQCVSIRAADLGFARPGLVAATFGADLDFDPEARNRPLLQTQADIRLDGPDTG